MAIRRKERRGDFVATAKDGTKFTIVIWQEILTSRTLNGPARETGGMIDLTTSTGDGVNSLGKGQFEVLAAFHNIVVTSTDPVALALDE